MASVDAVNTTHDAMAPANPRSVHGFQRIYGWTGVPMLVLCTFAIAWTLMLAAIQYEPTYVANYVMGTQDFDSGEFWMLPKPDNLIAATAAVALLVLAAGYMGIVVLMLFPDKLLRHPRLSGRSLMGRVAPSAEGDATEQSNAILRWLKTGLQSRRISAPVSTQALKKSQPLKKRLRRRLRRIARSLFGQKHHYFDSPVLVLPKLVFQTTTLVAYLRLGLPIALIVNYSTLLFLNWLIACYRFQYEHADLHRVSTRIFLGFDLFFAVFAPLQVLVYAYCNFTMDREEFKTHVEVFSRDSFERTARFFADPTQTALFRIAFQSLQLRTVSSLLMKCALNALTLWKWRLTIVRLAERAVQSEDADGAKQSTTIAKRTTPHSRGRLAFLTALVFGTGLSIFVYSIAAVVSSSHVCSAYEENCKVHSHRLNSRSGMCPCLVFVDRDTNVKTFAEWENPPDTTANLTALASTGHLQIIQIINRQLPTFPIELRKCTGLTQIILMFTKIITVPDWANELTELEYFHIEADSSLKQLTPLPRDLFINMSQLMFIHLGGLLMLPFVPDMGSLEKLGYLGIVSLDSITALPSFENLTSLRELAIMSNGKLASLPSVHSLRKLTYVSVVFRQPLCCNGFFTKICDLTHEWCRDRTPAGEPLVRCSTQTISDEDRAILTSTEGEVCPAPVVTTGIRFSSPSPQSIDELCGGVKYKECSFYGSEGICYPDRLQPIMCVTIPTFITMRKLQIARGVGQPCDPTVEQWLGLQAMAFTSDWRSMFDDTASSNTTARLGIDYVAASAASATVGSLVLHQDLAGLGIAGVVWNCARVLVDFFREEPKRLAGRFVVELGAGTGAVALALALATSPCKLVLSDLPDVVTELTQRNVEMAVEAHVSLRTLAVDGKLFAVAHAWGSTENVDALQDCDVVLCSDCLYEPSVYDALLKTLCLLSPEEVYIAYKQRHPQRERSFFEALVTSFSVSVWSSDTVGKAEAFMDERIFVCRLQRKSDENQGEGEGEHQ